MKDGPLVVSLAGAMPRMPSCPLRPSSCVIEMNWNSDAQNEAFVVRHTWSESVVPVSSNEPYFSDIGSLLTTVFVVEVFGS